MTDTTTPTATPVPAGAATHATQAEPIGYQPATPKPAEPAVLTVDPVKPVEVPVDPVKPANGDKPAEPAKPAEPVIEADPARPVDGEFKIPDEYKDKPWASKVKSQDDLYKQIDNLTALVGKKAVVPNLKEATAEDKEAFYAQLRGKDASEYQIPNTTSVPIPEDTQPELARLFMENGISPVQAEPLLKGYLALREKQIGEFYNPDGFKQAMVTAFGNDWEKVTGTVKNTISSMMSPDDAKALDNIPNNLLGVVYRTMGNTINAVNETLKKYGATETFAHLTAPNGQMQATDMNAQRATWRTELAALSMRGHTQDEKDNIINKIADSYKNDPRLQPA